MNQNNQHKDISEQLAAAQAEIAQYQKEIAQLRQALAERTQDIPRLLQWIQGLHQDITAVYDSITWKSGHLITQTILKLLRRPAGPTARDHINKIIASFEFWKQAYFQSSQRPGKLALPYYPWHDTGEYAQWIKQQIASNSPFSKEGTPPISTVISILMPIGEPNEQWLRAAIESVQKQIYPHFELLIITNTHLNSHPRGNLPDSPEERGQGPVDSGIKWRDGPQNTTLAAALNNAPDSPEERGQGPVDSRIKWRDGPQALNNAPDSPEERGQGPVDSGIKWRDGPQNTTLAAALNNAPDSPEERGQGPVDSRIKWLDGPQNTSLAAALNNALAFARGDFIALMGAEDQLPAHALYKIAQTLNAHPDTDLIYTDEDKLNAQGQRYDPYFKSDWNPDLFYSQNFLRHLTAYRRSIINDIGGFRPDYQGNEDYDLALRFIEQIDAERIRHIPQILYHRRDFPEHTPRPSQDGSQHTASSHLKKDSGVCALQAHFQRLRQPVKVVEAMGGHTRVIYPLPDKPPLVSLIIPTRDKLKLLRGTVDDLLNKTDYKNIEIIIMDNGSVEPETLDYFKAIQKNTKVSIIRHAAPFNYSQLNNIGVTHATGDVICLINNDLQVIYPQWLTEMVSHALRPQIGAVGAKLYYINDTIQHAGVIIGLGGMAGHALKFLAREAPGYHWKPFLIQNYSAVTGACLVMRRNVFEEVGGLEEKHLKVAFNDVDFCLRIRERGYRIVWTPYAELYHLESASRGIDDTFKKYRRLQHELNYMKTRWGETLLNDPYYNPNLTLEYEDFSLAWPPQE